MAVPIFTNAERRARLIARHHLGRTAKGPLAVVRGVAALHSTDPATPYLGCWARIAEFTVADLERELFERRALARMHAMRRTLFVVPADEVVVFSAGVGRDVARDERKRLEGWLGDLPNDGVTTWLAGLEERVLDVLADGRERRTQELSAAIPELAKQLTLGSGKWVANVPLSSRLLCLMAMEDRIVRTRPAGTWRSSQYHWAASAHWLGGRQSLDTDAARVELARRYLATHGPATLKDVRWWTGWTAKQVTAATRALDVATVALDGGREGLVLPGDLVSLEPTRHVSLLPALDPTPMGWQEREWYLGQYRERLFDRNGNIGPSVWVDGRIVGGWGQRPDGEVVFILFEDVGREATLGVEREAAELTAWMGGLVASPRFPTPLERELSGRGRNL